jgi:hypothetical protein
MAKAKGKSKATRKAAPKNGAPKKAVAKKSDLHGFFRKLYSKPEMMSAFTAGGESRQKVMASAKLSDAHQKLLASGCVPDIIRALSGAPVGKVAENSTVVEATSGMMTCSHPECQAFSKA